MKGRELTSHREKNVEAPKIFLLDIPQKTTKVIAAGDYYLVCEKIKDGTVQSSKYEGTLQTIEPPQIGIFSNHWPDLDVLSRDRLVVLTIKELPVNVLDPPGDQEPVMRLVAVEWVTQSVTGRVRNVPITTNVPFPPSRWMSSITQDNIDVERSLRERKAGGPRNYERS